MNKLEPNRNIYIGHRYVPKIFGEWDNSNEYEGLSIVTHQGSSYTSKKRVPVGINITNEEFWTVTGNYNAQIEYYREETQRVSDSLSNKVDTTDYNETVSNLNQLGENLDPVIMKTDSLVSSLQYDIVGDGSDETDKFQTLINENTGKKIIVAYPQSKLVIGKINIPSDTDIIFSYGMDVEITSGLPAGEKWFEITDVKNVNIYGEKVVFKMIKEEYETGEHRHAFNIVGDVDTVTLTGISALDSGGDGFYIGNPNAGSSTYPKNISLHRCFSDNNKRQGLSVTTVDGLYVSDSRFDNTIGTAPGAGIDIEPNSENSILKNIKFVNCEANNNDGSGIVISLMRLTKNSQPIDITFENCKTEGNVRGFYPAYSDDGVRGVIKFINCNSYEERLNGFCETDMSSNGVYTYYENCIAYDGNVNDTSGAEYAYSSNFHIRSHSSSPVQPEKIGNARFVNCRSIETRPESEKKIRRGFAISAENASNIIIENFESEGELFDVTLIHPDSENIIIQDDFGKQKDYTTSGNITNYNLGELITNKGSNSYIYRRLPEAMEGMIFKFRVESPHELKITPQSDVLIYPLSNDVNRALSSSTIGSMIELEGRNDGNWTVKNVIGVWEPDEHNPL